jgi:hypothetical protein
MGFLCDISILPVLYPYLVNSHHYSPSYSTPFLKMTSTGFNVPYLYVHRKYTNHIHPSLPSSFILSLLLLYSLYQDLLYIPALHCLSVFSLLEFCLGILPINIFTLIRITCSTTLSHPFPPPALFNCFQYILLCLVPTKK